MLDFAFIVFFLSFHYFLPLFQIFFSFFLIFLASNVSLSILRNHFFQFLHFFSRFLLGFYHFFSYFVHFFSLSFSTILQSMHAYIISIGPAANSKPAFTTHFDYFRADISWRYCQRCVVFRFTSIVIRSDKLRHWRSLYLLLARLIYVRPVYIKNRIAFARRTHDEVNRPLHTECLRS